MKRTLSITNIIKLLEALREGSIPHISDIDAALEKMRMIQIYFSIDWSSDD